MKINNEPLGDLTKRIGYLCNLCGWAVPGHDKMQVVIDFLRQEYGYHDVDDLGNAFHAFAAGRLDEKLDQSLKAMAPPSIARIMQSYSRIKMANTSSQPSKDEGRSYISDENKDLIYKNFGRTVLFTDEVLPAEREFLMRYWIGKQQEQFYTHQRADLLTPSSFDFLIEMKDMVLTGNQLRYKTVNGYVLLCDWDEVEDKGTRLKVSEDLALEKSREDGFRKLMSPLAGGSLTDAIKRAAVAIYYDKIKL